MLQWVTPHPWAAQIERHRFLKKEENEVGFVVRKMGVSLGGIRRSSGEVEQIKTYCLKFSKN